MQWKANWRVKFSSFFFSFCHEMTSWNMKARHYELKRHFSLWYVFSQFNIIVSEKDIINNREEEKQTREKPSVSVFEWKERNRKIWETRHQITVDETDRVHCLHCPKRGWNHEIKDWIEGDNKETIMKGLLQWLKKKKGFQFWSLLLICSFVITGHLHSCEQWWRSHLLSLLFHD
jgi:hypothetical protein